MQNDNPSGAGAQIAPSTVNPQTDSISVQFAVGADCPGHVRMTVRPIDAHCHALSSYALLIPLELADNLADSLKQQAEKARHG